MLTERLSCTAANEFVQRILKEGAVSYSDPIKNRIERAHLTMLDVENVLRCGRVHREAELEAGFFRYQVETDRMCIVVAFRSPTEMRLIGGWRKP